MHLSTPRKKRKKRTLLTLLILFDDVMQQQDGRVSRLALKSIATHTPASPSNMHIGCSEQRKTCSHPLASQIIGHGILSTELGDSFSLKAVPPIAILFGFIASLDAMQPSIMTSEGRGRG
jgi:hypothetical protein